ncbi:MAG TPA: 3-hydroxyacyl-CoA dehydrogenase NAD-binding domain-containing protein [Polyangiaceae bacterium]
MNADSIRTLAVIGAGQMGSGIAEVAASRGIVARLTDATLERAQASKAATLKRLDRLVEKGKVSVELRAKTAEHIQPASFEAAVSAADFVIEAATEAPDVKRELFRRMDAAAPAHAVLASNTSSISITRLAAETRRPDRVIGMHFFNPVPLMKLVELVRGLPTSTETLEETSALATRLDKTIIVSEDSPGFLINRMLIPFINEACFAAQERVGSIEHIDQGARLGLNHPMGPLELADFIGLDTLLSISDVLQRELGDDKYRPATILRNLVAAGWLGKKAGRGFYEYDESGQKLGPSRLGGIA